MHIHILLTYLLFGKYFEFSNRDGIWNAKKILVFSYLITKYVLSLSSKDGIKIRFLGQTFDSSKWKRQNDEVIFLLGYASWFVQINLQDKIIIVNGDSIAIILCQNYFETL